MDMQDEIFTRIDEEMSPAERQALIEHMFYEHQSLLFDTIKRKCVEFMVHDS